MQLDQVQPFRCEQNDTADVGRGRPVRLTAIVEAEQQVEPEKREEKRGGIRRGGLRTSPKPRPEEDKEQSEEKERRDHTRLGGEEIQDEARMKTAELIQPPSLQQPGARWPAMLDIPDDRWNEEEERRHEHRPEGRSPQM